MKSKEIFAFNLKKYRIENKLTQREIAEMCDLSTREVAKIEKGCVAVTLDTLDKISIGTGLSFIYLLTNDVSFDDSAAVLEESYNG